MNFFKRFLFSALLTLSGYLVNAQSFYIEGAIRSSQSIEALQLLAFDAIEEQYQPLAKIPIQADGQFYWQGDWPHANLYQLRAAETYLLSLAVDQPEKISIQLVQNDEGKWQSEVNGSTGTSLLRWFPAKLQQLQVDYFGELKAKLEAAIKANDQQTVGAVEQKVAELFPLFIGDLKAAAVDSIGTSVAAFRAWDFIDPNKGQDIVEAIVAQFQSQKPDLPLTRLLSRKLSTIQGLGVGVEAPGFELNDLQGKPIRLADYLGRYIYVDFWASWCLACRAENPKLVKLYEQYQGENFAMLGVGIKDQEEAWRIAIRKDGLPWTQVLDTENKVSEDYNLMSLPQNILLDPRGIIIARNLNAMELRDKLRALLKQ